MNITNEDLTTAITTSKDTFIDNCQYFATKYKLLFHNDILSMFGISKETYYKWHRNLDPTGESKKLVDDILKLNKIQAVIETRFKWRDSDDFKAQMVTYRLSCSHEERDIIDGIRKDMKDNQKIEIILPQFNDTSDHN